MRYPGKVKRLVTMGAKIFMNKSAAVKEVIPSINKQIRTLDADTSYKARNKARLMKMLLSQPNYRFDDLKIIQCPVLVIAGENDLIKSGIQKE